MDDKSLKVNNIINFYMFANKLKYKIRTGWIEIEIKKDRLESVAEHIYGTLVLAIGIDSEYELKLDMYKVLKMLTLHELEEILMPDYTIRSNITHEQKIEKGKICVHKVTDGLLKQNEIEELLNEFNKRETKEAIFCYHIDKIECDFQAKIYDLEKTMDYERAREDLIFYGDRAKQIDDVSENASDYWIEFDKPRFEDDEIFKELIEKIQNYNLPKQYNEKTLEKCLPSYLEKDLQNLKEGIKNNVSYLDCLIDELQGSVNSAYVDGEISEEQCDYLYKKYIRMEKEND